MSEVRISRQGSITVTTPSTSSNNNDNNNDNNNSVLKKYQDPSPNRLDVSKIDLIDDPLDRMVDSMLLSSRLSEQQKEDGGVKTNMMLNTSTASLLRTQENMKNMNKKFDNQPEVDNLLYNDLVSGVIGGYNSTKKVHNGRATLEQSSHDQYVALLEKENLELSEKALHLERELADSDSRYDRVSLENKHLLDELRDEIARSDSRAKEISTSLTGVRRETEEQANKEMALLRNELDLAVAKRVELENAFHVQTRTIAELSGENLELTEEMKNIQQSSENEAVLNKKVNHSSETIMELQNRLNEAQENLLKSHSEMHALRRESEMSQNKIIEESRIHNKSELRLNETMENMKRDMKQLEQRERQLRDDVLKKEGALGAMSHDRLKAVHELVLKEEEIEKLKLQYELEEKKETNMELEYKKKIETMKQEHAEKIENLHKEFELKTNRYIETNRKAETTIQQLNNLINEKSRENSNLQIKYSSLEQKAATLQHELNTLREISEAARADLSVSKSNVSTVKGELNKSKLRISNLEETNMQNQNQNRKLKNKVGEMENERSKIISVIKNQGEALSKLTLQNKSMKQKLRKLDDTMLEQNSDFQTIINQMKQARNLSSKHIEKLIVQERTLATQEVEIEDLRQNVARADIEHKTIVKLRKEVNEWRNKFMGMEKAAESATEICNELKREFGLIETKYTNETEMRKGVEIEYERLKDLVKPQTETMEQMAIELKRALEREQSVRNELRSVHARFAHFHSLQIGSSRGKQQQSFDER